jgi:hypothetical protein
MDNVSMNDLLSHLIYDSAAVFESVPYLASSSSHTVLLEDRRSWTDVHRDR